jgi:tRNA pseudouridine38-40 synthase
MQPGCRTVQDELQRALATVLRVPSAAVTAAGRTDAGVHAIGQVAHVDVREDPGPTLIDRLAGILPGDLRVRQVASAPADFDARFSALWRRYEYRISDHPSGALPMRRRFVLDHRRSLNCVAMADAAAGVRGLRDFVAFCKRRDNSTTIRTVQSFEVQRIDEEIVCTIQADAFCHSMVRSLVGALIAVGQGRRPTDWPEQLLSRTSRSNEVTVAAAHGLTLVEVGYPPDAELAARAAITRAKRQTQ